MSDGNDIAGVRLPDVTVPLATYTGWALRAGAQANDGCEGAGQMIPFAEDQGRAHRQRATRVSRSRSAIRPFRLTPRRSGPRWKTWSADD